MRRSRHAAWLRGALAALALANLACAGDTASDRSSGKVRLSVGLGAVAGGTGGVYAAADLALFSSRNLDVDFRNFNNTSLCVSAMLSNQLSICGAVSGIVLVNANLAGADLKAIGVMVDTMPFRLMVSSRIRVPADLVGKRLGITRPGASTDHAVRLGLARVGIDPMDVDIVSVGEQPQRVAALLAGSIDGTVLSPPGSLQAESEGVRILSDLSALGMPYPHSLILARTDFLREQPEVVSRFLEAVAEGTFRFKADRDLGLRVLARHLGVTDAKDLEATYEMFARTIADSPVVSQEGMAALLAELAQTNSALAAAQPDDFLDMRLARELQQSGVLDRLRERALQSTARRDDER
jgi:NitT/TauT family transport system substrate-binding protein